ncbi:MAG: Slp family lipoprotein [Deltaproteobacteria bacterium]|nr:Slp family lipoprotein [Deltaproteobacteria bacterium]
MKKMTLLLFLFASAFLVIGACSPFTRQVMQQVDEMRPFREIGMAPERYLKKTVLWGGVIIETFSKKDETLIMVRQTELDMVKRPTDLDVSSGRFILRTREFLDPDIYAKGREITVVGEIAGMETRPLGEIQYRYPVIQAKKIRLWGKRNDDHFYVLPHYYPHWPHPYLQY